MKAKVGTYTVKITKLKSGVYKVSTGGFYREFSSSVEAYEWFAKCVSSAAQDIVNTVKNITDVKKTVDAL